MAKVLRVDPTGVDAYITKNLVFPSEFWITFGLMFPPAALAAWTIPNDDGYSGAFLALSGSSPADDVGIYVDSYFPGPEWFAGGDNSSGGDTPAPVADVYQLVEFHFETSVEWALYVDGTLVNPGYVAGVAYGSHDMQIGQLFGTDFPGLAYFDSVKVGTTRGGSEIFEDDFESGTLAAWDSSSGDAAIVDDPLGPAGTSGPASYEWRFVVTKLNLRVLTFLDRLARDKTVTYALNRPAVATGVVPSDNPEVNIVQSDGFPLLEEGVRCLLGFRREGGDPPWVIRFAGIIEQLEDNVDEDAGAAPYSTYTAYDPWQYLYRRPIRKADGTLPGQEGLVFTSTPGNEIALALLERTFDEDGEHHIEIERGSMETTDELDIDFQQGTSVGEAWDQLCETGNIDIILTALYDPVGFPDKLATFNCYSLAGTTRHKAAMAWDKPSRSLVGVNRLKDGDQRANRIQYYYGQGGPKAGGTVSDFAAAVQYGDYWAQQSFPGKSQAAVELLAAEQLLIRARGMKTYRLNPTPGSLGQIDSPLVFLDYFLGDTVPIFASRRLRHEIAVGKRVIGIPIDIADDGRERINELSVGEGEEEVS